MIPFAKYHGLGNDFLIVDLRQGEPSPSPQSSAVAQKLCDRHFGVGADGVLAILPPTDARADVRMRIINSDGSEAEMCGNGIRCVAKYLFDRDPRLHRSPLQIETLAGVLACGVDVLPNDQAGTLSVQMGRPRLTRGEIPMTGSPDERCVEQSIVLGGENFRVTAVSMGNPHAVIFASGQAPLRALAERIGSLLETHAWFPQKTNAEFARLVSPTEIELVVWERGCGITLACGTGACATATAACLTGHAEPGRELTVNLLGGALAITVAKDFSGVTMRGPATQVYEATVDLAALLTN